MTEKTMSRKHAPRKTSAKKTAENKPITLKQHFSKFCEHCAHATGSPYAFVIAVALIVVWAISGPIFQYSEVWQLVINTTTTIITFLLVFLIQNAQNRDARALQIKIDEILYATEGAQNALLDIEELSEEELKEMCKRYEKLAKEARAELSKKTK
ncbi:MAG: low affinity iron permease family protein [Rickettsiales bacterium]